MQATLPRLSLESLHHVCWCVADTCRDVANAGADQADRGVPQPQSVITICAMVPVTSACLVRGSITYTLSLQHGVCLCRSTSPVWCVLCQMATGLVTRATCAQTSRTWRIVFVGGMRCLCLHALQN